MTRADIQFEAVTDLLTVFHHIAPHETAVIMRKYKDLLDRLPKRSPGSPLQWTIAWHSALVIFVDRSIHRGVREAFKRGEAINRISVSRFRLQALEESLRRRFPFRKPTIAAARKQYFDGKKRLRAIERPGQGLRWIHTALDVESFYKLVEPLGEKALPMLREMDKAYYDAFPEWIWEKLKTDGRLLMPDVPRKN